MGCGYVFELRFCEMQGHKAPHLRSMFSHTIAREILTISKYFDNFLVQHYHTIAREIFTNLKYFDNCLVQQLNWITT
jgi:hypothetical protein